MPIGAIRTARIVPEAKLPVRASDGAVGWDVFARRVLDRNTKEPIADLPTIIEPGDAKLIGIGVIFAIPWGYEVQVRPRSGLASKHDIELSNSPGTVDPDFRGEVGVLLRNRGSKPFTVEPDMRIAQLIFNRIEIPKLVEVEVSRLPPTRRGVGGFGSTGLMGIGLGTSGYEEEMRGIDHYMMEIVLATARFSDCVRGCKRGEDGEFPRDANGLLIGQTRRYGCVIAHGLRIIASGFNAQYPGSESCAEVGCLRESRGIPSGERIEVCRAVHAEQAAIDAAAAVGPPVAGGTIYVNAEPCLFCARQIAGLGVEALVILEGGYGATHGLAIIEDAGIVIRKVTLSEQA